MSESGGHGQRLAERLHSERSCALVSRSPRRGIIGFTEIYSNNPIGEMSDPIQSEDAFLVAVQLRDFLDHHYWERGRQAPIFSLAAFCTTLYDLSRDPVFLMDKPFHSVNFYFPRAALDAIADGTDAPRIADLRYQPGKGTDDPVMRGLTSALYPTLEQPEQASRLFVDHVTSAVGLHVARTYGGLGITRPKPLGGLAPWQERRVKEIMDANLGVETSLAELAKECGLSVGHFSRAFRQTTGTTPHRWLLQRRVEFARQLLRNR